MNTPTNETTYSHRSQTSPLAKVILERIEHDAVKPSPRWRFLVFEYGVWVLWVISILLGAISIAVILFSADHARFALFEVTHRTLWSFYLEVLPYLWIALFTAMAIWAYVNLRHTRHGYRYPFWQILLSSLVFSVIGGLVLHWLNFGMIIDHTLGQNFAAYPSVAHLEERMWEQPARGLLVGELLIPFHPTTTTSFIDDRGVQWTLNTNSLPHGDTLLLYSGSRVRLLGTTTDPVSHTFYVCGVFPWEFDRVFTTSDLQQDRQNFLSRVQQYVRTAVKNVGNAITGSSSDQTDAPSELCHDLDVLKRIQREQGT